MKLVYVAMPYGGDPENYDRAKHKVSILTEHYKDMVFISPILAFGHMYNTVDYDVGMDMCLTLLEKCDEVWVFYGHSKGVNREIAHAVKCGIPVVEW